MLYLVFKSIHLILVISWMAGLFYLPRLFVYLAEDSAKKNHDVFFMQIKRLLYFITPIGIIGIFFGALMIAWNPFLLNSLWLKIKIGLVFVLFSFNLYIFSEFRRVRLGVIKSTLFYRIFNESVVIILIPIIFLSVFKWQ